MSPLINQDILNWLCLHRSIGKTPKSTILDDKPNDNRDVQDDHFPDT